MLVCKYFCKYFSVKYKLFCKYLIFRSVFLFNFLEV
nr:MAG TPA: hypothetical protein [Caudoviricetes sp.]DAT13781.1 MAG TPA: hypothetical protein [Caudoviricetes sp.]